MLRDETIELSYHPEYDNGKKLTNQQKTLRLREEAAFERDRYDARKLMSWASQVPQIYTRTSDDVQVAVNSIPHIDPEQPISIGMRIPATGQYTISWPEISGAFPAKSILLEDTQAETTHDLHATQSYTFQADEGNIPERLKLHFSKEEDAITGVDENEPAAASIWYHNNTLYVYSRDQNTEIRLYDINGRHLKHHQPDTGLQSYQIKLPAGIQCDGQRWYKTHGGT